MSWHAAGLELLSRLSELCGELAERFECVHEGNVEDQADIRDQDALLRLRVRQFMRDDGGADRTGLGDQQ